MKLKFITMCVLQALPPQGPNHQQWCMDPAMLRGRHGWPHGHVKVVNGVRFVDYPFLVRAPLTAGIVKRMLRDFAILRTEGMML